MRSMSQPKPLALTVTFLDSPCVVSQWFRWLYLSMWPQRLGTPEVDSNLRGGCVLPVSLGAGAGSKCLPTGGCVRSGAWSRT